MGVNDILNPTIASEFNPDYPIGEDEPQIISRWQAKSAKTYSRVMMARGEPFKLTWSNRLFSTYSGLKQWYRRFARGFFTLADYDRGRYYSVQMTEPTYSRNQFNNVDISAEVTIVPGLPMFQYPTNWGVDSFFLEERDDFGDDLVKLTGSWSFVGPNNAVLHGGGAYESSVTNDTAEWLYFGYGFRFWSIKQATDGIVEISLDGTVLTTVDLYNATELQPSPLYTNANVNLGLHRVKLRVTGTKNAASSGTLCWADAIEVMG